MNQGTIPKRHVHHSSFRVPRLLFRLLPSTFCLVLCTGCPQYADPTVPEPIVRRTEPVTERDYFLYVPSKYDARNPTPLVILCHGTTPFDTAAREIRDWVGMAERKGFIVAAPKLEGTRGDIPPPADMQITRQRRDEKTILGVVNHVCAGYNIADKRIFIAGWSAGGFAVLHTGLRHPEIFRAAAVMQGNFNEKYLVDAIDHIDPYQPVFVIYGTTDLLTGNQGRESVRWLYDHDVYVFDGQVPGPHRAHPQLALEFFERVLREVPLVRISAKASDPDHPLNTQFSVEASVPAVGYEWHFGDGKTSSEASPMHRYTDAGSYDVKFGMQTKGGKRLQRSMHINVPLATVHHALGD